MKELSKLCMKHIVYKLKNLGANYGELKRKSILVIRPISLVLLSFFIFFMSHAAYAYLDKPIATDSRIRTFVYSPNEVFKLIICYGYQTNIEFSEGEEIRTISVGNNYAWQLSPLGRRLFIKPLEENILTNMTLITNKYTYQFELQSKDLAGISDDELVYVVRFFYPDEEQDIISPETSSVVNENDKIPTIKPYNFDYQVSGSAALTPLKVFDDGIKTYFKFSKDLNKIPLIEKKVDNKFVKMGIEKIGDYVSVNAIDEFFYISLDKEKVTVINNKLVARQNGKNK